LIIWDFPSEVICDALGFVSLAGRSVSAPSWTRAQLRLVGEEPDAVVAAKVGRSVGAVKRQRVRLGLPTALDRRRRR
jgi:hypothetical protein